MSTHHESLRRSYGSRPASSTRRIECRDEDEIGSPPCVSPILIRLVRSRLRALPSTKFSGRSSAVYRSPSTCWPEIRQRQSSYSCNGGPGVPHTPFAYVDAALADSFLVVNWDQRGTGKSLGCSGHLSPLTFAQLVSDGREVVEYLCAEFDQPTIFVVGHSCGSVLGMRLAAKCPNRIRAFVGIGQVSNLRLAQKERYRAAQQLAGSRGDAETLSDLELLGPPPYDSGDEGDELERIAARLRDDCLDPFEDVRYRPLAVSCPLYCERDWRNLRRGTHHSQACLWEQLFHELDLATQVPALTVPVAILTGQLDTISPLPVVRRFFEGLQTRRGKRFRCLPAVGHWPHLQAPQQYQAALCELLEIN